MKRRQAAVVFNDIQGYTSLMQENEAYAIQLRQRHKEVVDRLTREFKGTIIQYYGDGTLSIFDTSLDAVQCALSMQQEFSKVPQIPLRIGINAGDILLGPDGIYGDSVNIASRIERMSVPGSVLISERVFEEIKNYGGIQTRDLGQFELKNVRHPMNIHAVISEGVKVPDPVELAGKIGYKEKTILVLPFYNLSKDPENDFFSDGITEQIIYTLSEIEGLRVTSRTSSFTFKDKQVNLRQLHQELGIDNVLEGSVRRHGNKVRITAQLINAADDFHLWSETYNREVSDVFQVQDEIAAMISNKLKASFQQSISAPEADLDNTRTPQPEVYEYYHKGRYYWKQMQPGYIDQSIHYFRKAVETDMNFFLAWPALAKAYAYKGYNNLCLPSEAGRLCLECLEEAGRLNPDHSRTHSAWALYHLFFSWDWEAAIDHLRKACNNQDQDNFILFNSVLHASAVYHITARHTDQALTLLRKALKMDPLNMAIQMELAKAYLYHYDFRKALDTLEAVINARPDFLPAYDAKGWVLFSMGRQREGIEAFEYYKSHSTLPIAGLAGLAYAYARTLQSKEAEKVKELMITVSQDLPSYSPHYDLALAHLGAQEYQSMFDQLHLAIEARIPSMIFLEANPIWDEIRRFNEYRVLTNKLFGTTQRPPL
jgi:adenylate cyclase